MITAARRVAALSALLFLAVTFLNEWSLASLPGDLAPVLFPENSGWRVGKVSGAKSDLVVAQVDGRPVYKVGASGLTLTSKDKVTGDVELRLRFRLTSPDDKGCSLTVAPGLPKESPAAGPLYISLNVMAGTDPEFLIYHLQPLPANCMFCPCLPRIPRILQPPHPAIGTLAIGDQRQRRAHQPGGPRL